MFLPDDRRVLVAAGNTLYQWDSETGKELHEPVGHTAAVRTLAISEDDRSLFSAGADGKLRRWDLTTAREDDPDSRFPDVNVTRVVLSPGARYALAIDTLPAPVHLIDVASRKEVRQLPSGNTAATSGIFLGDSQAVTGNQDGTLRLWDVEHGTELLPPQSVSPTGALLQLVPTAVPGQLLCVLASGAVTLWDRDGGKELRHFAPPAARH